MTIDFRLLLVATAAVAMSSFACGPSSREDNEDDEQPRSALLRSSTASGNTSDNQDSPRPRLTNSGLDLGERAQELTLIPLVGHDTICLACEGALKPSVLVAGSLSSPSFVKDVRDVDAVLHKWGFNSVTAAAIVGTETETGALEVLVPALVAPLKAKIAALDLTLPIVPALQASMLARFNLTMGHTLMVIDPSGTVVYGAVVPPDLAGMDDALQAILGPPDPIPTP